MNQQNFKKLTLQIRQLWERQRGLVVEMFKYPDYDSECTIAVGKELNPRFVASKCRIWRNGQLLYEGDLESRAARVTLSKLGVCLAAYRTANTTLESKDWKDKRFCYGNPATCKKNCALKVTTDAESDTVQSTGEAVSQSGDSE